MSEDALSNGKFVSVIIPCRNEEHFIAKCLDSIIANDYPKDKLEILVVDGMSGDKTRDIVGEYASKYTFVKLLDNPKRITPIALNTGIKNAKGDVIMRMDAHAICADDYISKCVKYMAEFEADNIGGTMVTLPRKDSFIGRSIVCILTHRFGVGGSVFRTGTKEPKWVDTVFGGFYRREVFDKVGLFNENLASSQDMEFNLRLKRSGGKILLHPDIVSYYYTRSDLRSFWHNNFRNGVWAIYPMKFVKHMPVSMRHLVPLAFVTGLIGSALLSIISPIFLWLLLLVVVPYSLVAIYASATTSMREKNLGYLFVLPILFASLHIGYGLGSIVGAIKLLGR